MVYFSYFAVVSIFLGIIWIVVATLYSYYYGRKAKDLEEYSERLLSILKVYDQEEDRMKNPPDDVKDLAFEVYHFIEKYKKENPYTDFGTAYDGVTLARELLEIEEFDPPSRSEALENIILKEMQETMSKEEIDNIINKIKKKHNPNLFDK